MAPLQYAVGIRLNNKSDQVAVEAEDALIAALKPRRRIRKRPSLMSASATRGATGATRTRF